MLSKKQKAVVYFLVKNECENVREAILAVKDVSDPNDIVREDILRYDLTVYDDVEADEAMDEAIENYIDECVMFEIPKNLQNYFDYAAFKQEASYDGRGHWLSGYDGNEFEAKIGDKWYYVYRN